MYQLFSSESVTEGHPDKVADFISDSILDACLEQDPFSRVAIETAVTTNYALLFGEITSNATIDFEKVVKDAIKFIGYNKEAYGYNADEVKVEVRVKKQSDDIALGVNKKEKKSLGAGDQGFMFGYANNDTDTFLPLPIYLAHRLAERLTYVRKQDIVKGLRPDGKTQVTIAYDEDHKFAFVHTIVLSTQHDPEWNQDDLHEAMIEHVIKPVFKDYDLTNTAFKINPTGRFVMGGPHGDAGLTGRKIIVDTYGGYARHGGGAFSGKDATKVDRSAAYMARYIAKNIVASGIADACEIQLAYAIGIAEPISVNINTFGTEKVDHDLIYNTVINKFDLTPRGIIKTLDLNKPIYRKTTQYGHFGKSNTDFTWEKLDKIELFKELL
ncbi:MAG: methionine adenosyltransferase [Acholeplasmataceae bacterium]